MLQWLNWSDSCALFRPSSLSYTAVWAIQPELSQFTSPQHVVWSSDFCTTHLRPQNHLVLFILVNLTLSCGLIDCILSPRLTRLTDWIAQILISYHQPSRSLRSSSQSLLQVPRVKTDFRRRAFSAAAPQIWNHIPAAIKVSPSLDSFKRHLKTHYLAIIFSPPSDSPAPLI